MRETKKGNLKGSDQHDQGVEHKSSVAVMPVVQMVEYPEFTLTVKLNPKRVILSQHRYFSNDVTSRTAWRALLRILTDDMIFLVHDVSALTVDPPNKTAYLRLGQSLVTVMSFLFPRARYIRVWPTKPPSIWKEWEFLEVQCLPDNHQVKHFTSMGAADRYMRNPERVLKVKRRRKTY